MAILMAQRDTIMDMGMRSVQQRKDIVTVIHTKDTATLMLKSITRRT